MFYVQHQFEDVYWARNDEWNFAAAALEGSSYYKLPKVLQWFTGNIGFHHKGFACAKLNLIDEENGRLVSFKYLKEYRAAKLNAA